MKHPEVVGIGNEFRHDDAAGIAVARIVAGQDPGSIVVSVFDDPLQLLGWWDGAELTVVADAVRSGARPGTITITWLDDAGALVLRDGTWARSSTHGMGVASIYRLARTLGRGPIQLVLVGIEGADFSRGIGMTGPVAEAVPVAARKVSELIEDHRQCA